jgi:hypothetical protein
LRYCPHGDLRAQAEAKFAKDVFDMYFHRCLGDHQAGSDLPIVLPIADQACNVALASS